MGPRDQVRKQQHEQRERPERIDRGFAAQSVHEVRNKLERKKADADRKDDVRAGQRYSCSRNNNVNYKVEIFECSERKEVDDDAEDKCAATASPFMKLRAKPGSDNLTDQQRYKPEIPPRIKKHGSGNKNPLPNHHIFGIEIVDCQRNRQKRQDEHLRLEKHSGKIIGGG
jgi:hypothetical protein